ncbi:MAG: tRNA (adenosine(37)-N6)-dimethylallyltransferase MiaA [Balneolaceae bacterium]
MIVGPTASGKTELACMLAPEINGEIISVDARQCYKRIDTGTAKPDHRQMKRVPHYNISVLELEEKDSVVAFLKRAEAWKDIIMRKGKSVLYAGGSTLHLQSLIQPIDNVPGPDQDNLAELKLKAERDGLDSLFRKLKKVDPVYAGTMDGLNRHRIMRALDVWMQSGRPFSSFHRHREFSLPEDLVVYGLCHPRRILHQRINSRVDRMIDNGLVEETRQLLREGYPPTLQSLQTVGYRDVIDYLNSGLSRDRMIGNIKTQTRRYAKRQITWFRRWPFIRWLNADELSLESMIREISGEPVPGQSH